MQTTTEKSGGFWVLFPLFLLIFIDTMGNALYFPILTPILFDAKLGVLSGQYSLVMRQLIYGFTLGIFPLAMFFSSPILGDASDKFGRKKVLLLSLLGTSFGYCLSAIGVVHHSATLLIVGRIIDGITAGNYPIAQAAIIDLSPKHKLTVNLAMITFCSSIGFIFGPMLGGTLANGDLVSWFSLATPLFGASLFALVNSALLIFAVKESFPGTGGRFVLNLRQSFKLVSAGFKDPKLQRLCIIYLLLFLAWGGYIQYVSVYVFRVYGFRVHELSWFMTVMACCFAISSTIIIRILDRFLSPQRITLIASIAICLGTLLTVAIPYELSAWIAVGPIAMGVSLGNASLLTMFSDRVADDHKGWVMGVASAVLAISLTISAFVAGVVSDLSPSLPIWLAGLCLVPAIAMQLHKKI